MNEKGSNLFEKHIEKIVLAVLGLISIWLLITRVLISPNYISYQNHNLGPDTIDEYIIAETELLKGKLERKPEPIKEPYKTRIKSFVTQMDSSLKNINTNLYWPQPVNSAKEIVKSKYHVPLTGKLSSVEVEHIRTVAYVPIERIDEEVTYSEAENEPMDIDLVTVQASIDIAGLYERFYENFAGKDVPAQWHDTYLAKPVFAAVQLQRKELLSNGSWSDWQIIPRIKIDHRRELFKVIENVEDLPPGGVKVRQLQFSNLQVQINLLQPETYSIASAKQEWFPPSVHKEFVRQEDYLRIQKKLEKSSEGKQTRDKRPSRSSTKTTTGEFMEGGTVGSTKRQTSTLAKRKGRRDRDIGNERTDNKTIADFYDELNEILITDKTDFAKIDEPLIFWAHDDTTESGKSYQYRIRAGVFNPIAGTSQFLKEDKRWKNTVVLWSDFSDVTEPISIPGTLCFFASDIQEADKRVTVQVCRYVLGYWYSKDFTAKPGETIGEIVEFEPPEEETQQELSSITVPTTIDYSTKAVLIDVVRENDWKGGKNLRPRYYSEMLYSFDGSKIEHMPIKSSYWPEDLYAMFTEIARLEKEPKEPLRPWNNKIERFEKRYSPTPGTGGERAPGSAPTKPQQFI